MVLSCPGIIPHINTLLIYILGFVRVIIQVPKVNNNILNLILIPHKPPIYEDQITIYA
jgi:hypothetical protein